MVTKPMVAFTDLIAEMKPEWPGYIEPLFDGATVCCVGCGPSLLKTDVTKLPGRKLATNSSWRWLVNNDRRPVASVFSDSRRLREEVTAGLGEQTWPVFAAPSGFACPKVNDSWARYVRMLRNWVPLRGGGDKLFLEDGLLSHMGGQVIFHAIALAVFLGAKRVVLVGVDCDYSGPSPWWHGGPNSDNLQTDNERVFRAFRTYRNACEERGVELLNATVGGKLEELERVKLEDL